MLRIIFPYHSILCITSTFGLARKLSFPEKPLIQKSIPSTIQRTRLPASMPFQKKLQNRYPTRRIYVGKNKVSIYRSNTDILRTWNCDHKCKIERKKIARYVLVGMHSVKGLWMQTVLNSKFTGFICVVLELVVFSYAFLINDLLPCK